jgi:hypothetical protein
MTDLIQRLRKHAGEHRAMAGNPDLPLLVDISGKSRVKSVTAMAFHQANLALDLEEAADRLEADDLNSPWRDE